MVGVSGDLILILPPWGKGTLSPVLTRFFSVGSMSIIVQLIVIRRST